MAPRPAASIAACCGMAMVAAACLVGWPSDEAPTISSARESRMGLTATGKIAGRAGGAPEEAAAAAPQRSALALIDLFRWNMGREAPMVAFAPIAPAEPPVLVAALVAEEPPARRSPKPAAAARAKPPARAAAVAAAQAVPPPRPLDLAEAAPPPPAAPRRELFGLPLPQLPAEFSAPGEAVMKTATSVGETIRRTFSPARSATARSEPPDDPRSGEGTQIRFRAT
jgi:hypothetical protein